MTEKEKRWTLYKLVVQSYPVKNAKYTNFVLNVHNGGRFYLAVYENTLLNHSDLKRLEAKHPELMGDIRIACLNA